MASPGGSFLVVTVHSAEAPEKRKHMFSSRKCRYFVRCQYGSDATNQIRTPVLPGPICPFNQTFRLQLDGRSSVVNVTLMRERRGGKMPVAMGGISFNIAPDIESAAPVERVFNVSPGCSMKVGFAAEVPHRPAPSSASPTHATPSHTTPSYAAPSYATTPIAPAPVYETPKPNMNEVASARAVIPADPAALDSPDRSHNVSSLHSTGALPEFDSPTGGHRLPAAGFDAPSPPQAGPGAAGWPPAKSAPEAPKNPCYAGVLSFVSCDVPAQAGTTDGAGTSWRPVERKGDWRSALGIWDVQF